MWYEALVRRGALVLLAACNGGASSSWSGPAATRLAVVVPKASMHVGVRNLFSASKVYLGDSEEKLRAELTTEGFALDSLEAVPNGWAFRGKGVTGVSDNVYEKLGDRWWLCLDDRAGCLTLRDAGAGAVLVPFDVPAAGATVTVETDDGVDNEVDLRVADPSVPAGPAIHRADDYKPRFAVDVRISAGGNVLACTGEADTEDEAHGLIDRCRSIRPL